MKGRNLLMFYNGNSEQSIGFIMAILAPFAASIEVFLRRDMGVRYFTFTNFIAGLIVIWLFRVIYSLSSSFSALKTNTLLKIFGADISVSVNTNIMYWVWLAYVCLGIYHFMYQYYRDAVNKPAYSFFIGDSHLFFIGKVILGLLNKLFYLPVRFFAMTLPAAERQQLLSRKVRFTDYRTFTYRYVEPLFVLGLGLVLYSYSGVLSFWLVVSAVILALYSSYGLQRERNEFLDLRDGKIQAEHMQAALVGKSDQLKLSEDFKRLIKETSVQIGDDLEAYEELKESSPAVADVLANLNPNLKNL